MKDFALVVLLAAALSAIIACSGGQPESAPDVGAPTPSAEQSPSPIRVSTTPQTPLATTTPTSVPASSPTPTLTPVITPAPSATPTPSPSLTDTPSPASTAAPVATPMPPSATADAESDSPSPEPCINGVTVPDPEENTGLVNDCFTLLALGVKETLAGSGRLNWSADTPITAWQGVIVGGSPARVRELRLSHSELSGELPLALGRLDGLEFLNLRGNQLTGEIPAEFASIGKLLSLELGSNKLTGNIPPELGRLAGLKQLHLNHNQLTGRIPAELGNLTSLRSLDLYGNQLQGNIPPELGNMKELFNLRLGANRLTGEIPVELARLLDLASIGLHRNQLSREIPPELGRLKNLHSLSLDSNLLTGELPVELANLPNLTFMELQHNQLTGEIPPGFGALTSLDTLNLNYNQFTGRIPPELGRLKNLRRLALGGNRLTGEIPPELGRPINLKWLSLHPNQLFGCIPLNLGNVDVQSPLKFCDDSFADSGDCPGQSPLCLCSNDVAIPDPQDNPGLVNDCAALLEAREILAGSAELGWSTNISIRAWPGVIVAGSPSRVVYLHLNNRRLTGEIPAAIANLTELWRLDLSSNEITGEIPAELGQLNKLGTLNLMGNQLTGEIPPEIGSTHPLRRIILTGNQLTGCIPGHLRSAERGSGLPHCPPTVQITASISPKQEVQRMFDKLTEAFRNADAELLRSTLSQRASEMCELDRVQPWVESVGPEMATMDIEVVSLLVDTENPNRALAELATRADLQEDSYMRQFSLLFNWWPYPVVMEEGEWRSGLYKTFNDCPFAFPHGMQTPAREEREERYELPKIPGLDLSSAWGNWWATDSEPGTLNSLQGQSMSVSQNGAYGIEFDGLLEADFPPRELIQLYRSNWETPAWNIRYEGTGDGAAWLIWTVHDSEGYLWRGSLVATLAGEGLQRVSLFLYSSERR